MLEIIFYAIGALLLSYAIKKASQEEEITASPWEAASSAKNDVLSASTVAASVGTSVWKRTKVYNKQNKLDRIKYGTTKKSEKKVIKNAQEWADDTLGLSDFDKETAKMDKAVTSQLEKIIKKKKA